MEENLERWRYAKAKEEAILIIIKCFWNVLIMKIPEKREEEEILGA